MKEPPNYTVYKSCLGCINSIETDDAMICSKYDKRWASPEEADIFCCDSFTDQEVKKNVIH